MCAYRSSMHKTSEWLQSFSRDNSSVIKSQHLSSFRPCTKISVTGGKGGVGKTSIALKAAQELAKAGHRTLLIDCDSNLSNTAIKLSLPMDNKFEKLLAAELSFEECLIQDGNFHLLPACNGSIEVFESKLNFEDVILDIVSSHEHDYDFILLDCPAGISKEVLTISAHCDHRFVVVTPDKSSITDSYSLMKILATKFNVSSNHVIVNMVQSEKQYQRVVATLTETIRNFIGAEIFALGGIAKLDVSSEAFDTFFLSESKNEFHKNFVKLLYGFTEKVGGPVIAAQQSEGHLAHEQDVH